MNEFRHFLRKITPGWKTMLIFIGFFVFGYVEYIYVSTYIIWFIAVLFAIIDTWINIHFWNKDRKTFKRRLRMFKQYELDELEKYELERRIIL